MKPIHAQSVQELTDIVSEMDSLAKSENRESLSFVIVDYKTLYMLVSSSESSRDSRGIYVEIGDSIVRVHSELSHNVRELDWILSSGRLCDSCHEFLTECRNR